MDDILAICICIAAIKLLRFSSLNQAFKSFVISVSTSTIVSIILHYVLPRSYNDYASELSSPLFITLPDLINNLFKKCSWLPVLDVIIPGVLLSYLRRYDENFHTGFGGVYTVIGNLSFILSTALWIILEALYPFSIPFSLVTYSFLFAVIILTSIKRNELKTLWEGRFNSDDRLSARFLKEERLTFGKMVSSDMIEGTKAKDD